MQSALVRNTLLTLSYRNRQEELEQHSPYVLALLLYSQIGMEEGFKSLDILRNAKVRMRIWADLALREKFSPADLIARTGVDDLEWVDHSGCIQNIKPDYLFVPILPFSFVTRILRFDDTHLFSQIIMDALLRGKKVGGMAAAADPFHPAWREYGYDSSSSILKNEIQMNLSKLKSYGFTLIKQDQLLYWISRSQKKKVLSEEDVIWAYHARRTQIYLSPQMIVTPLAIDAAKQYGIELIKNSRGM